MSRLLKIISYYLKNIGRKKRKYLITYDRIVRRNGFDSGGNRIYDLRENRKEKIRACSYNDARQLIRGKKGYNIVNIKIELYRK